MAFSVNEVDLNSLKIQLPSGVSWSSLQCRVEFSVVRACGHTLTTTCSEAYFKTYKPCRELIPVQCPKPDCKHLRNVKCSVYAAEKRSGKAFICHQPVQKICEKCGINKVEIACCKPAVDCHSEVTVTLARCGHEVSWVCGSEEDPRDKEDECQACMYPLWESLINEKVGFNEDKAMINELFARIENVLDCFEIIEVKRLEDKVLTSDLVNLCKCRAQIVGRYLENAKRTSAKISPPKYRSLGDQRLYELVFVAVNEERKSECSFEQEATVYGRGYSVGRLSKTALNNCKPDANGRIHVVVGVAFGFKAAPLCPPFCATLNKKGENSTTFLKLGQSSFQLNQI